ncbi:hypothetical protein DB88DRAFT_148810 [Papiliotrema laurentii]|uniref:Uncharacterized protein n=1 Tax=Papiliotrema laurentii TaxID=5418 RepID=A0AAD9FTL4_PAPLA|nr:hypothetical protein DB88DRAFT_148810 [Papiliotrema laurentii]
MRFFFTLSLFASLSASTLARPVEHMEYTRQSTSDVITSALPVASTFENDLGKITSRVVSDPLLALSPYVDTGKSGTYNVPKELEDAVASAVSGLQSLPSLPTASNPTQEILDDYGPLVVVVARTLEYSLIDLKLLTSDTLGPFIPGYTKFVNGLDDTLYKYTKALNSEFKGFSGALATRVGADTPLGKAIQSLGGQTFAIVFDHI